MKTQPKAIKARVNQDAHREAQQYALKVRDVTLVKPQSMAEPGMTQDDLLTALVAIKVRE
jgi:hypothetical protein